MIENTTVEFKREYNEKVNNTMLAFLNTDGGTLYLGLSDDGSVYGIEGNIDLEARKVTTSFRDAITPDPSGYFNVEPEKRNDQYIIKITVSRGSAIPYCFSKYGLVPQGVYVRIGSNTVMLSLLEHRVCRFSLIIFQNTTEQTNSYVPFSSITCCSVPSVRILYSCWSI
jgi:predicted HTH transcriptional regulator